MAANDPGWRRRAGSSWRGRPHYHFRDYLKRWRTETHSLTLSMACIFALDGLVSLLIPMSYDLAEEDDGSKDTLRIEYGQISLVHRAPEESDLYRDECTSFEQYFLGFSAGQLYAYGWKTSHLSIPHWSISLTFLLLTSWLRWSSLLQAENSAPENARDGKTVSAYFKPWRRKIGVGTLLTAFLFCAIWMRGNSIRDWCQIYTPLFVIQAESPPSTLRMTILIFRSWPSWSEFCPLWGAEWRRLSTYEPGDENWDEDLADVFLFWPFSFDTGEIWGRGFKSNAISVGCHKIAIITLLTFVSASLLLSRPRSKTTNREIDCA